MKKILPLTLIFAIAIFVFQSCKKESAEQELKQSQIEFSFKSNQLKMAESHGLTHVIVSIEDMQANVVKDYEKIEIYNMNGYYISKPISLVAGEHKLTHFMVLNADNNVVYASPKAGSAKAYLVQEPLDILFTTYGDAVTKLSPEVLSTSESSPENFGYSTFSFKIAETFDFLVGAFVYNETSQNFELTTAEIAVYNESTLVYSGQLKANIDITPENYDPLGITNKITLPEAYNSFTIKISKLDYTTYNKTFTKEELRLYYRNEDNGPLVVTLEEACKLPDGSANFLAYPTFQIWPNNVVTINNLSRNDADVYTFDFGDGTTETQTSYSPTLSHTYNEIGTYTIKLAVLKDGCIDWYQQEVKIVEDIIPGLVAYYPFNGNANDESGNGHHGTDYGASGYITGHYNSARTFSNDPAFGVNATDYIEIPNVINSEEFTVSFWTNFQLAGNHQMLIFLSVENEWNKANFYIDIEPTNMRLAVFVNGLDLRTIDYSHQALKDGKFSEPFINSAALEIDKYYNVTCTFVNSEITLYLDGVEYAKYLNVNKTVGTPNTPIKLGLCTHPTPGFLYYPLVGQMDELRFYNRALTELEIISLNTM